jgi:hypothetical protein
MQGLPLLGLSLDEPVCWYLVNSREMVLWLTFRVCETPFCDCPAWKRGCTFRNGLIIWISDESRFLLQKRMAEYGHTGAGMNVSLPPVCMKWISTMEVVSRCGRNRLKGVQSDSNPAIWKAMIAH